MPAPKTTPEQVREMALRVIDGEALSHIAPSYGSQAPSSRFTIRTCEPNLWHPGGRYCHSFCAFALSSPPRREILSRPHSALANLV